MLKSYSDLLRLANACGESQTLLASNNIGVFTAIGKEGRPTKYLARKCKADVEGLRLLLDALVSLGLLTRTRSGYRNTPLARRYLDRGSPDAITNLLWLMGHHWHDWTKLPGALRTGRPGWAPVTATPEFRERFSLAMHERSHMLATPVVRSIRMPSSARLFLDLGGGPGSYAIALAKQYPHLHGLIMDQTVAVAKRLVRRAGISDRLKVRAGDIFKDDLGSNYDVILCSNVIHVFNETENRYLLRRASQALRRGGKLLIVEFFLDRSRAGPPKAAVFSVMMWLYTATGRCYSWDEVEGWLKALRFGRFKRHDITPEVGLLEATKV